MGNGSQTGMTGLNMTGQAHNGSPYYTPCIFSRQRTPMNDGMIKLEHTQTFAPV
jgi:hypothetical protein